MKFHFQAIDEKGRVQRGVLRAESAEAARDVLLAENIFAKKLDPADEAETVTWAPKVRRENRGGSAADSASAKPVRAFFETTALLGFEMPRRGRAGLTEQGAFVFECSGEPALVLGAADVEAVVLAGFPYRVLRLTLLSGRMYEFAAGLLFANSSAKEALKALRQSPTKAKS